MMITDINILSEEEIFKAKLEARNHFIFKHRLRNDEIKKVQVFSDPIMIDGKTYLHSIINEV